MRRADWEYLEIKKMMKEEETWTLKVKWKRRRRFWPRQNFYIFAKAAEEMMINEKNGSRHPESASAGSVGG